MVQSIRSRFMRYTFYIVLYDILYTITEFRIPYIAAVSDLDTMRDLRVSER
jgi:hypothetical protein